MLNSLMREEGIKISDLGPGQVAQLVTSSSQYTKVAGSIPCQSTERNQPVSACISGTSRCFSLCLCSFCSLTLSLKINKYKFYLKQISIWPGCCGSVGCHLTHQKVVDSIPGQGTPKLQVQSPVEASARGSQCFSLSSLFLSLSFYSL